LTRPIPRVNPRSATPPSLPIGSTLPTTAAPVQSGIPGHRGKCNELTEALAAQGVSARSWLRAGPQYAARADAVPPTLTTGRQRMHIDVHAYDSHPSRRSRCAGKPADEHHREDGSRARGARGTDRSRSGTAPCAPWGNRPGGDCRQSPPNFGLEATASSWSSLIPPSGSTICTGQSARWSSASKGRSCSATHLSSARSRAAHFTGAVRPCDGCGCCLVRRLQRMMRCSKWLTLSGFGAKGWAGSTCTWLQQHVSPAPVFGRPTLGWRAVAGRSESRTNRKT
jgi:hypothetical protein